jgi:hypothetical protein
LRTSTPNHYAHWPISPAQWELHAAAGKANGCKVFGPCGVGAYPDTTSAKRLLAGVTKAFADYMQDADLDPEAHPVSKAALIFSWATRRYFGPHPDVFDHRAPPEFWSGDLIGWGKLLIEQHVPFDMLVAEQIQSASQLNGYELIVLPNVANASDRLCSVLGEYARAGGRVLASGECARRDETNQLRGDSGLAEVLGISCKGAVNGPFAIERPMEPEPAAGVFQQVAATGQVMARRWEVDPAGSVGGVRVLDPLPVKTTNWPVIVRNVFGKGESLYAAFEIGRFLMQHGDLHIEALMKELLDALLPVRQIHTNAPRTVEITVWRQPAPERLILHFANRTVAAALHDIRHIAAIIPVRDIEVTLPKPYPQFRISARQAQTRWHEHDGQLTITLDRLEAYAAVVIEEGGRDLATR